MTLAILTALPLSKISSSAAVTVISYASFSIFMCCPPLRERYMNMFAIVAGDNLEVGYMFGHGARSHGPN